MNLFPKKVASILGSFAVLALLVIAYNFSLWLTEGNPAVPRLEGRWWAGYYQSNLFGKQWCVARFVPDPEDQLKMVLLSSFGPPDSFSVESSSSSRIFVYLTFDHSVVDDRIEAKQLYVGKRYFLGRLIAGRFWDFWKMNDDITIRGHFVGYHPDREFAIEPIEDERLLSFWSGYVRPDNPSPSPSELLISAGFHE